MYVHPLKTWETSLLSFEFGLCLLLWLLTGWFVGKALGIANWRVDQMSIDDMKFGRTPPSPNFFPALLPGGLAGFLVSNLKPMFNLWILFACSLVALILGLFIAYRHYRWLDG